MDLIASILFLVLTLSFVAFFSGIEMAFYSTSRLSIEARKKKRGAAYGVLTRFNESPAVFLGMTLLGHSFFLVLFILLVHSVMVPFWHYVHISSPAIILIGTILTATFLVLIFGEFIPRILFRANSSSWFSKLAGITAVFYNILRPLSMAGIGISEWIMKYLFNVHMGKESESLNQRGLKQLFRIPEEEIRKERSAQLMENAQELPKVRIRQCLVPRKEIIGIDIKSDLETVKKIFVDTRLSKLVVYEKNIDHIIGYIHQLDLFKKPYGITEILHPIFAVPESMTAANMISTFIREQKSIAWVVDEFGGTAGIITLEDVLEEIFGEIQDEYDTEEFLEKVLPGNEYIFSGRLELDYLENKYALDFSNKESETLSGYIINHYDTIPQNKERIIIEDYEFEILTVSETRIETVKLRKLN